jgi:hypothetical protein
MADREFTVSKYQPVGKEVPHSGRGAFRHLPQLAMIGVENGKSTTRGRFAGLKAIGVGVLDGQLVDRRGRRRA